ncbi:MAG: hypothetical protein L3J17_08545 [Candidatus Jettenia sp.]|nr:MAG: hypothetical protein L3J17_08545 [Candidatus Jettenia sp.]
MNNIEKLSIPHPLTKIDFDKLFNGEKEKLFNLYNDYIKRSIGNLFEIPSDIAKTITFNKESSGYVLKFPDEVVNGIKEGKYKLPKTKNGGISPIARNQDGTIKKPGELYQKKLSVVNVGIGLAHLISNLDMQNQLEEIKEAIDQIYRFQISDRVGDLKGVYDTLQNWLNRITKEGLIDRNIIKGQDISERLDRLENQFFENAKMELEIIKNPSDYGRGIFGFSKHLNFFGKTPEQKAKEILKKVFENLQYTKICNFLNLLVCGECEDIDAYERTSERLYFKFEKIYNTLDLKCQYSIEVYRALKEGKILKQELSCIDKQRKPESFIKIVSIEESRG